MHGGSRGGGIEIPRNGFVGGGGMGGYSSHIRFGYGNNRLKRGKDLVWHSIVNVGKKDEATLRSMEKKVGIEFICFIA